MADTFNHLVEQLRNHMPGLFPTAIWDESLDREIATFAVSEVAKDEALFELSYGLSIKAGFHLWNESLNKSHTIAQEIPHATGSYWHGIMHRMEGDYDNAKYWFRQVGSHEVFERLQAVKIAYLNPRDADMASSSQLRADLNQFRLQGKWDPFLFVDLVQDVVTSGRETKAEKVLSKLQKQEIIMLLEYSYRNASGGQFLESIG